MEVSVEAGRDARQVALEGQHVEVAHHLHVLAALVALGDLDLDRHGVAGGAVGGGDAGPRQGGLSLAGLNRGDAPLDGADAV